MAGFTIEQAHALAQEPDTGRLPQNDQGMPYIPLEEVCQILDDVFGAGLWGFRHNRQDVVGNGSVVLAQAELIVFSDKGEVLAQHVGSHALPVTNFGGISLAYKGAMTYAQRDAARYLGPALGRNLREYAPENGQGNGYAQRPQNNRPTPPQRAPRGNRQADGPPPGATQPYGAYPDEQHDAPPPQQQNGGGCADCGGWVGMKQDGSGPYKYCKDCSDRRYN